MDELLKKFKEYKMSNEKNQNICSTAYRVLLILVLLNNGKYTIEDLIDHLSNNEVVARSFSKDVIIKYINTLKVSGFQINRSNQNKNSYYYLCKSPFLLNLTKEELYTLALICLHVESLHQTSFLNTFNAFLIKMYRLLAEEDIAFLESMKLELATNYEYKYKKLASTIQKLEQHCNNAQTLYLSYTPFEETEQKILLEPESLEYSDNKVFLTGNNLNILQKQALRVDYIREIQVLSTKASNKNYTYQVTFRLRGKLARNYRLYEGEKVLETKDNPPSILISAIVGDLDVLLNRLLRYGYYCEVISPLTVRDKIKNIINETLTRYKAG